MAPSASPQETLPAAGACAQVSAIDSASISNLPLEPYFHCDLPRLQRVTIPAFSFIITNAQGRRVLFDLGLRKDWTKLSPTAVAEVYHDELDIRCEQDVRDILEAHDVSAEGVEAIILSHHHFDHIGDPSRFPSSTALIVGPGVCDALMPGYPDQENAEILTSDYSNRPVREIDFTKSDLSLLGLPALDYFGDGSLYLLSTPGHAVGHVAALVRTTADGTESSFVLLGGDACHHCGELRPSTRRPLPSSRSSCVASFLETHDMDGTQPFFQIQRDPQYAAYCNDSDEAQRTIFQLQRFDALDNVLIIFAHDITLKTIIDEFPATLNDWRAKGWGDSGRWRFLQDFEPMENL
ncbi:Uncharacterized protein PECH_008091 [Penicillium ucsense]|uniref:Metallo-beta-lactamase domain-containing protein n=1 Tax=Penicillium ucsense TaxID=2839758 RepID=A0A8J8WA99_9EURO|nr:Uncharacterized protein PECM_003355 [Penicillium ucsense]KAF7738725.1 Uncharacterized protein PECH_008091 [Penicillium ucsense]